MEFFDGLAHLELGYRLIIMGELMKYPVYQVQVLSVSNYVPNVKITGNGRNMVNEIQKYISTLCMPYVPKVCQLKFELKFKFKF